MENRRYIQDAMSNRSRRIPLSSTVVWDLDRDYHFLVTGTTGSGKTKAAEYLMINLSELGYRVYYLDPKQDEEMRRFSRDCGIIYASGIEKIAQIVHETEEEMRKRGKALEEIHMAEFDFAPIYIVFDELIAYQAIAPKKTVEEVKRRLTSIITMGRSKQVFCGLIMVRPDTAYIDGVLRDQLGLRLVMGQGSEALYTMAFGKEHAEVKNLRSKKTGSGLIMLSGYQHPREVMMPYIVETRR